MDKAGACYHEYGSCYGIGEIHYVLEGIELEDIYDVKYRVAKDLAVKRLYLADNLISECKIKSERRTAFIYVLP